MQTIQLENQLIAVNNIFCIGRNYDEHIKELNNTLLSEPIVFLKPNSALLHTKKSIILPTFSEDVHYECEMVVYINKDAYDVDEKIAMEYVGAYALGLDLTARDVQNICKQQGLPWTKAKGFRGAACVSPFLPKNKVDNIHSQEFSLKINGQIRQQGNTIKMIFSIPYLIAYLSRIYGLQAGDLIYTGTPAGVGALKPNDKLELFWADQLLAEFQVHKENKFCSDLI